MSLKILQNSKKNIFAVVSFLIKLQARNLKLSVAATGDVLQKKALLKKQLENKCFPMNFVNYSRTPIS